MDYLKRLKPGDFIKIQLIGGTRYEGSISEIDEEYIIIVNSYEESYINIHEIAGLQKTVSTKNPIPKIENGTKLQLKSNDEVNNPTQSDFESSKELPDPLKSDSEILIKKTEELLDVTEQKFAQIDKHLDIVSEEISDESYMEVPWDEVGVPKEELFKGREDIIDKLIKHYKSSQKDKTYILFGLTRTGKSSIIDYFSKKIECQVFRHGGETFTIIPFIWHFGTAASHSKAEDLWGWLVKEKMVKKIETLSAKKLINPQKLFESSEKVLRADRFRFSSFQKIITNMRLDNLYPLIIIDEFSFFTKVRDKGTLDESFLSFIRDAAIKHVASFLFAGTYEINELFTNPKYGITAQFANVIKYEVNQISEESAKELINAWEDRLSFDDEAIKYIMFLSGRIPYFIQIICKNCGYYALERNKWKLNHEDLEFIVSIITGELDCCENSRITEMGDGVFLNNQYDTTLSLESMLLLSTICFLNKGQIKPRGVGISEIFDTWGKERIKSINIKVSNAISSLKTKGILIEEKESEYRLLVDLFRRWWAQRHSDMDLELNSLEK
jgi:hypothetical protein